MKKVTIALMCCSLILFLYGLMADSPQLITGGLVFTACMLGTYIGACLKEEREEGTKPKGTLRLVYLLLATETLCLAAMLILIVASLSGHIDLSSTLVVVLTAASLVVLYGIRYLLLILKAKK